MIYQKSYGHDKHPYIYTYLPHTSQKPALYPNTSTIWYVQKLIPAQHWFTAVGKKRPNRMKTLSSSMYSINLSSSHRRPTKVGHPGLVPPAKANRLLLQAPLSVLLPRRKVWQSCASCRREGKYSSRRGCRLRRRRFASNPELDLEVEDSGKRDF